VDEAHQARVHRRDVVVAADGIASVTVTLEDCIADKPLVLATLSPPYSVIEFQPFAYDETNTQIQVERHETRRRVVIAAIRPQPFVGRRSLTWKFRVSNAYPFTLRDLIVPPENFYQTGAAEHAGRSCVLRVSAAELVQSIRFEQAEAPLGQPRAARTLVEAQRDHWHGVGKQWVRDGAASTAVDTDGSRLVARFKSPLIGRRYGIVFKLEEVQRSRAHDELSKQWIEAQRWICRLANVRGERSRSAIKLQRQLTRATHRQLCEQFEVKDLDCEISWTSKGFIWHAASHTLRPTFGCFRIDDWAQEFPPGAHTAAETTANFVQRPMTVDEFKAALTDRSLVTKISGGAKLPRLETSICARATSTDSIFGARRR
jgi:hypothetical protein